MINEAYFSVTGYVATQPKFGFTPNQVPTISMRIGWTPRRRDRNGDWADEPSSFASITCFRKIAENAAACLRKGDPVVVKGTLRIREYESPAGVKRVSAEVVADSIGHDLSRGTTTFSRSRAQLAQTALDRWREEQGLASPRPDDGSGQAGPEDQLAGEPADGEPADGEVLDRGDLDGGDADRGDEYRREPDGSGAAVAGAALTSPAPAGGPGPDPEDAGQVVMTEDDLFDEDEAMEILSDPEPVGTAP